MTAPTPTPAVALKPWFSGSDPIAPVEGVGGFHGLVPVAEPLSAGPPPSRPELIDNLRRAMPSRMARSVSNHVAGCNLDAVPRPAVTVKWTGLSKAQRDTLLEFLEGDAGGGLLAFDVEPDGPGTGAVKLRATAPAQDSRVGRGAYAVTVETEEVW